MIKAIIENKKELKKKIEMPVKIKKELVKMKGVKENDGTKKEI
jgi:hypothetical protein